MKRLLTLLVLGLAFALSPAQAGMISTDELQAAGERERVKAMLERPEVVDALEKKGVLARDAVARVDAMSDAEVRQLAGRLDSLPAGAALSTNDWLLIIVIILLVLIII